MYNIYLQSPHASSPFDAFHFILSFIILLLQIITIIRQSLIVCIQEHIFGRADEWMRTPIPKHCTKYTAHIVWIRKHFAFA